MADWQDGSDVVEVVVKGLAEGQAVVNVLHYATQSAPTAPNTGDLVLALANFRTFWRASVLPLATPNYSVTEYTAGVIVGRSNNPNPPPVPAGRWLPFILSYGRQEVLAGTNADVGGRLDQPLPTFNAAAIKWPTRTRNRWSRTGTRFYIGGENDTTNNSWNAAAGFLASAATLITKVLLGVVANAGGDFLKPVAFGRTTYLSRPAGALSPWTYTSYFANGVLNPYVSSQVSRKQRVRPQ